MANRRNDRPSVSDSKGNLTYIRGSLRCLVKGDGSVHRICVFRKHLGQPAPGFHFEGRRIWFHMPPSMTAGTMGPRCFNPRISKKKVGFYLLTHTQTHQANTSICCTSGQSLSCSRGLWSHHQTDAPGKEGFQQVFGEKNSQVWRVHILRNAF